MTVDFVVHGDEGVAGPWAAAAKQGEEIFLLGPGGAYVPEAGADWHLLAGDESALPAIAASLARMPAGVAVHAFIEVAGPEERQELEVPAGAEIHWLYRGGAPVGRELVAAVRALEFPAGQVQAFVHGEAGFVKELRRLLRVERDIPARPCPSPATGVPATTRTAGRPPSATGTSRSRPSRSPRRPRPPDPAARPGRPLPRRDPRGPVGRRPTSRPRRWRGPRYGVWQTASMLLPSGSRTKAP